MGLLRGVACVWGKVWCGWEAQVISQGRDVGLFKGVTCDGTGGWSWLVGWGGGGDGPGKE